MNPGLPLSVLGRLSVQAAVVVLVILLVQALFRKWLTPRWRCALWLLLIARLLLPVSLGSAASIFNFLPFRRVERVVPNALDSDSGLGIRLREAPPRQATRSTFSPDPIPAAGEPGLEQPPSPPEPAIHRGWHPVFFSWGLLWLAGFAAFLIQVTLRAVRWRYRFAGSPEVFDPPVVELVQECAKRLGIATRLGIFESGAVGSPVLYGVFRPRLILPRGFLERFGREEIRFVILHEMAHLKRGDLILNWLTAGLQAIHWFNPLVWLGFSRWRADRELACDAAVLQIVGARRSRAYGETIIQLLERRTRRAAIPGCVGVLEAPGHLQSRLAMIGEFKPASQWSGWALILLIAVAAACLTNERLQPRAILKVASNLPTALEFHGQPLMIYAERTSIFDSFLGHRTIDGLPFEIRGGVKLYGQYAVDRVHGERRGEYRMPVNAAFAELHLIHASAWSADLEGAPVATIQLFYVDGSTHQFTVSYGAQVRDWLRTPYEGDETLADPDSKLIFRGEGVPEIEGSSYRFFTTVFRNPHPGLAVSHIEFISAKNQSCYLLVAATIANADPRRPETPPLPLQRSSWPLDAAIRIRVVDQATGRPIPGSLLTIAPRFPGFLVARAMDADADAAAVFRYSSQHRVPFEIAATHAGYLEKRQVWQGSGDPEVTLALSRGVPLRGRVLDPAGKPVGGAAVLDGYEDSSTTSVRDATTDAAGDFAFANLHPGPNSLVVTALQRDANGGSVRASRFPTAYSRVSVGATSFVTVTLAAGRPIHGRIVDPEGRPVAGARVRLNHGDTTISWDILSHVTRWLVTTDADGRFAWDWAPPGQFYLDVSRPGYKSLTSALFPAKADEAVFTLGPPLSVHGSVTEAKSGRPIPRFTITLGLPEGNNVNHWLAETHTYSEPAGAYDYVIGEPASAGSSYVIRLAAEGYAPFVSQPLRSDAGAVALDVPLTRAN